MQLAIPSPIPLTAIVVQSFQHWGEFVEELQARDIRLADTILVFLLVARGRHALSMAKQARAS